MRERALGRVDRAIRRHAGSLRDLVDGFALVGDCKSAKYVPDTHGSLSDV